MQSTRFPEKFEYLFIGRLLKLSKQDNTFSYILILLRDPFQSLATCLIRVTLKNKNNIFNEIRHKITIGEWNTSKGVLRKLNLKSFSLNLT